MKKKFIFLPIMLIAVIAMLFGCKAKEAGYDFKDMVSLAGKDDKAVVELLGEGHAQTNADKSVGAREYTGSVLGKKASVTVIYNGAKATEISAYFEDKCDFEELCTELEENYGEPIHETASENVKNAAYETKDAVIIASESADLTKIIINPLIEDSDSETAETSQQTDTDGENSAQNTDSPAQ